MSKMKPFHLIVAMLSALVPFQQMSAENSAVVEFIPFEDFNPEMDSSIIDRGVPQWYQIEIGYAIDMEPPPGKLFLEAELPKVFSDQGTIVRFQVLLGQKSQYADYTLINLDPNDQPLVKPFAIGKAAYAAVIAKTNTTASVFIYYYNNESVKWNLQNNSFLPPYTLNGFSWSGNWQLPVNMWLIESTGVTAYETIKANKPVIIRKYEYRFVRIRRI